MVYHRVPKSHYNPTDWRYKPRNHAVSFVYSFVSPFNPKFIFQNILHYIPYFPHSIPIHKVYATSVLLLNLYTSIIFKSPKTADPNSWGILRTHVSSEVPCVGFWLLRTFWAPLLCEKCPLHWNCSSTSTRWWIWLEQSIQSTVGRVKIFGRVILLNLSSPTLWFTVTG